MSLKNVIFLFLFLWGNFAIGQTTASPQIHLIKLEAPQLDTLRTVRIYLPVGYSTSKHHYPVVYMHDAQNLFDNATAFAGEWKVDEFLDTQKTQKVIVVGIDHGNEKRISELTPFPNEKYGGGEGEGYLDFIANTLKPHIDSTYRTLPEAQNTTIFGSSLGGLISFYAALKHPDIFGKAGVFSPSFWFSDEIYDFAEAADLSAESRIYFLAGTDESEDMTSQMLKMKELLLKKGMNEKNLSLKIVEGGEHNEAFWSSEFPEAFYWLFPRDADQ